MSSADRRAERGFTLIEMLVALAIFGMAALALLKLVGVSIASAGAIDRGLLAQMTAQNILVEAMAAPVAPPLGASAGTETNGGVAWRWSRTVSRPDDIRLTRIDVAVADPAGRIAARVSSLRMAGVAP